MSEPENFVARWSRLKREDRKDADPAAEASTAPAQGEDAAALAATAQPAPPEPPPFDPASLPSIESITAGTDIRGFLQSGVPAELTKAALRRVWTTDPAIRDFIGIAENQWDFTDPTAMPGFGPLEATDDVGKLVAQAMGRLGEPTEQLAGPTTAPDPVPASSVQRTTPTGTDPPASAGMQAAGIPAGNASHAEPAETPAEQAEVDVAAQNAKEAAELPPVSNRRPRGSALPK